MKYYIFFISFLNLTLCLLESEIGKHDWHLHNLGEIKDLIFFKNKRLVILNEPTPTFSLLSNGIFFFFLKYLKHTILLR